MTPEQEEALLQDAFYGREDSATSGISDDETEETEDTEVETVEEETSDSDILDNEEEEEEEAGSSQPERKEVKVAKKKNKSNFAKILAERNALRREREERMKSKYDTDSLEDLERLIDERSEAKAEERLFFRDNPHAKEVADEIRDVAREHNMDVETAYKFHLAMTNPSALLDSQTIAKKEAKKLNVS